MVPSESSASPGPQPDVAAVVCDFCGRRADGDVPPFTWTVAVENGRRRRFCEECSRAHLRSMEAKLDSEWW